MKNPNQILHDDFVMAQVEDTKTGIIFFVSEITFEEFNVLLFRNANWHVLSVVRVDD